MLSGTEVVFDLNLVSIIPLEVIWIMNVMNYVWLWWNIIILDIF